MKSHADIDPFGGFVGEKRARWRQIMFTINEKGVNSINGSTRLCMKQRYKLINCVKPARNELQEIILISIGVVQCAQLYTTIICMCPLCSIVRDKLQPGCCCHCWTKNISRFLLGLAENISHRTFWQRRETAFIGGCRYVAEIKAARNKFV